MFPRGARSAYDADGNLVSQTDATGTTTCLYNGMSQQTRKTLPGGATIDYTWDGDGNLATVTDGGGTTTYTYNNAELVTSVDEPGTGGLTSFVYDADDRETSRTYPNGVIQTISYDASGRITQVQATKSGTLTRFTYSNADPVSGADTDLRSSVTNLAGATTSYTYDVVGRLLRAKTGTASDYQYTYDGVGNRLTQNANGTLTSYSYNAADELTAAGSTTYSYDANGNQTGSSAGLSLSYNAALQTTSITPPGGWAVPMTYAGSGQTSRVSAGGTTYVYDLRGMSSETTASTTTRYVRDPSGALLGERIGNASYYYLYDGLGSVVGLTDPSGAVVNTYAYDPYGNVVSSTGTTFNRWKFAGGYQDPTTGLIKFGQRYYDPTLGRWTQTDPVASDPRQPAIASSFSYACNDPVNHVDPTGLVLVTGGSGGKWLPRWRPTWTPRWSPGWHPTWTPMRSQVVRPTPGGSAPVGGTANAGTTSGSRSGCLGAVAFGGQAMAGGGEAAIAGAEAFGTSLAAGFAMTGIGLAIVGLAAVVIIVACK